MLQRSTDGARFSLALTSPSDPPTCHDALPRRTPVLPGPHAPQHAPSQQSSLRFSSLSLGLPLSHSHNCRLTCPPPIRFPPPFPGPSRLLTCPDPGVRSRVCNLLGNMCRHSAYFYGALERHGLLPPLIERCTDPDKTTRKFACFAIGNAGAERALN